jgi:Flp pilus assembly pilin Flp
MMLKNAQTVSAAPGQPALPRDLLADADGQAATEYALMLFLTLALILAAVEGLRTALLDYYQDLASLICLPIP